MALYVNTPELIYASILAAIVIFGFAWWLCSRYLKGHILKEQLRFGKEKQEGFAKELETLKREVSQQGTIVNDLRSAGGVPRTRVELVEQGKCGSCQFADQFRAGEYESRSYFNLIRKRVIEFKIIPATCRIFQVESAISTIVVTGGIVNEIEEWELEE